ncbi:MAG: 50S ribosomal protein L22 [Candidatus Uhrbacteria bacterium GW2011_GWF2_39_13]|uniref:Large ribosomal subunit protein uL22 n=1 Tax=Candidatus Uhrbacteria bacterium GW2011_GWF2_39_13 TaxID=1618995 RepID=A0A0G0MTN3_9BACT|nr:MAG: 50S ribosomal protein L22 [Candidatus Uhrbacteria bacterium GW2011_GWF2_39_13]HAU66736.1 50S ribosomal protein L22 [Candidatus Uhrbacteria bacterium]
MEVKATARYIHMSPRKVRLVIDVIRGLKVNEARSQLHVMKKAAAEPVMKLLNSAIANAEHNFNLNTDELYIKQIFADGGPTLGRWRARAFGRAAPIRKRTTHIAIILDERLKTLDNSPTANLTS